MHDKAFVLEKLWWHQHCVRHNPNRIRGSREETAGQGAFTPNVSEGTAEGCRGAGSKGAGTVRKGFLAHVQPGINSEDGEGLGRGVGRKIPAGGHTQTTISDGKREDIPVVFCLAY